MSYIEFVDTSSYNPQRKTKTWVVQSTSGSHLGEVRFFPRWRCYTFFPADLTTFNDGCLRDIADFVRKQTKEWRMEVETR